MGDPHLPQRASQLRSLVSLLPRPATTPIPGGCLHRHQVSARQDCRCAQQQRPRRHPWHTHALPLRTCPTQVLAALPLRCIVLYPVLPGVSSTRDGCVAAFLHRHGGRAPTCVCPAMITVGKPKTSAASADVLSTPGESYCCASARCLCRSLAVASQCSRHASSSPAKAFKALSNVRGLPDRCDNSCGRLTLFCYSAHGSASPRTAWQGAERDPLADALDLACGAAHGQRRAGAEALRCWTGPARRGIVGAIGVAQGTQCGDTVVTGGWAMYG